MDDHLIQSQLTHLKEPLYSDSQHHPHSHPSQIIPQRSAMQYNIGTMKMLIHIRKHKFSLYYIYTI